MKANAKITVCFSSITPESAEYSEFHDSGKLMDFDGFDDLESAVDRVIFEGAYFFSGSEFYERGWYCTGYSVHNYGSMEEIEHTFHLDDGFSSEEKLVFYHMFMLKTRGLENA